MYMTDGKEFWDGMENFCYGMEIEWKKMPGWKMEKRLPIHPMRGSRALADTT